MLWPGSAWTTALARKSRIYVCVAAALVTPRESMHLTSAQINCETLAGKLRNIEYLCHHVCSSNATMRAALPAHNVALLRAAASRVRS